jgi:predicted nucleic acid-binding protein
VILVDSSAWIEEIRRTDSSSHRALRRHLKRRADIVTTEPVIMELLAGSASVGELYETRARMLAFPMVRVGGLATYEHAAAIWRTCRTAGEQLRNRMDCLIAAVAIREDASLLHQDRDFDVIARHTPLRIEPVR